MPGRAVEQGGLRACLAWRLPICACVLARSPPGLPGGERSRGYGADSLLMRYIAVACAGRLSLSEPSPLACVCAHKSRIS